MNLYADTGFLVSLQSDDDNTAAAKDWMRRHGVPMIWTWLHELEFRNAIRLQCFREQITEVDVHVILEKQAMGLESGVYIQTFLPMAEVSRYAEQLSATHSSTLGNRSLDILHVAQALILRTQTFLTFDKRQAELARAAGLRVPKL